MQCRKKILYIWIFAGGVKHNNEPSTVWMEWILMCRRCKFAGLQMRNHNNRKHHGILLLLSSPFHIHLKMIMEDEKRGEVLSVDALSCFFETTIHC